jgi:hypothetical protein
MILQRLLDLLVLLIEPDGLSWFPGMFCIISISQCACIFVEILKEQILIFWLICMFYRSYITCIVFFML